ncbi:MAG: DUF262 domain-containing protein [Planctomycetaceae bacterium]|nr:DUF262 domain-containing protein [Planctomycetaceae bacterium]
MKTSPTNKKIRELISMVKESKLLPRPEFQRRLVWSRDDKNLFLDSVLRGYPFPEIYFADGDVNLETGEGTQLLVDGLQRVSTLVQYFEGDPALQLTLVPAYRALGEAEKKSFLQYDVAVRDLGSIRKEEIIDVFRRLNATKYSLLDIEINNAIYAGALKKFCERIADSEFFSSHETFSSTDLKRMGDLRYVLTIVCTMLQGYFNRDDAFEALLDRYNDEFSDADLIERRLRSVFDFVDECAFPRGSRAWKKSDLFTLLIELDHCFYRGGMRLQPSDVVENVTKFYKEVDSGSSTDRVVQVYSKAAIQASNDRINRVRRGLIISQILEGNSREVVEHQLDIAGLA